MLNVLGSIYMTLAIAVERYATVCQPYFRVRNISSTNLDTSFIR